MKVSDLFQRNLEDDVILNRFFEIFPTQIKSYEGYQKVLQKLRKIEPSNVPPEFNIEIVKQMEEGCEDDFLISADRIGNNESLPLLYTRWKHWMNSIIDEHFIKSHSEVDAICYCLYEMTYIGFDDEDFEKEYILMEEDSEK